MSLEMNEEFDQVIANKLSCVNLTDNEDIEFSNKDDENKRGGKSMEEEQAFYSIKSFENLNLNPQLLQGIYDMGFNKPSKLEEKALPILLSNPPKHLIAHSRSFQGIALTTVLAMLGRVNVKDNHPQVLWLSKYYGETYEITNKVLMRLVKYLPEIEIKHVMDDKELPESAVLSHHIIIGKSALVLDWSLKYKAFHIQKIRFFIMDKEDLMVINRIIGIHKKMNPLFQMFLISTLRYNDLSLVFHLKRLFSARSISNIIMNEGNEFFDNITQYYVKCSSEKEKYDAVRNIYSIIENENKAIIYCNTEEKVQWLFNRMSENGYYVVTVIPTVQKRHDRSVALFKFENENIFRWGRANVLITEQNCLGHVECEQVTIIINFDLPKQASIYMKRIKNALVGPIRKYTVFNLVDSPQAITTCKQIEQYFDKDMKLLW